MTTIEWAVAVLALVVGSGAAGASLGYVMGLREGARSADTSLSSAEDRMQAAMKAEREMREFYHKQLREFVETITSMQKIGFVATNGEVEEPYTLSDEDELKEWRRRQAGGHVASEVSARDLDLK